MMAISIALADDHQLVRKGIRLILENINNFSVVIEASNGRELVDQICESEHLPDLVLVDVNMPVLDGRQTVEELRSRFPSLKLIALSISDELHVIRDLIRLGANAYLFKDSSPDTFEKVLCEVHQKGFYYDNKVIESLMAPERSTGNGASRNALQKQIELLSNRELEFIQLCCSELTYKEIADRMNVSQRTVDGYRESAFDKLNARSRAGLILFAFHSGLFKGRADVM